MKVKISPYIKKPNNNSSGLNLIWFIFLGPGGQEPLVDIEGQSQEQQQKQQQMLIQEEQDIEQLQERERAVRQLESDILDVNTIFKVIFLVWVSTKTQNLGTVSRFFGFFEHSSCKNGNGLSDN